MFGLGLSKLLGGALIVAMLLVPVSWQGGRWYQGSIDRARFESQIKLANAEAAAAAEKAAREKSAEIILKQAQATTRERELRKEAEAKLEAEEAEARQADREAENAQQTVCYGPPPPIQSEKTAAEPQTRVIYRCPQSLGDDEFNRLRNRYPSGPIRQRPDQRRAGPR